MADHIDHSRCSTPLGESFVDVASDGTPEDDVSEKSTAMSIIRKNSEEDDCEIIDDREMLNEEIDEGSVHETPVDQESPDDTEPRNDLGGASNATLTGPESEFIRCEELESSFDAHIVDAVHAIHVFDEQESAVISRWRNIESHATRLSAILKMKLSTQPLTLDRPLRVLYVGDPEQRSEVLGRFGDALMATPSSMDQSQFQVIATSDEPNAPTELVPIQAQIIVDECCAIASVKTHQGQQEQIHLRLKKGKGLYFKSTWNDGRFELHDSQKWVAPDLAVLLFSHSDNKVDRERLRLASEFMRRHSVSMLVLSDSPAWMSDSKFPGLDSRSLHLGLQSIVKGQDTAFTIQRLPTDLETFARIDAYQLNRHIAALLTETKTVKNSRVETEDLPTNHPIPSIWRMKDIEKNLSKSLYQKDGRINKVFEKRALELSAALILTLFTALMAYCFFWALTPKPLSAPSVVPVQSQSPDIFASTTPTTTSTLAVPSVKASALNSLVSLEKYETSLSTIPTSLEGHKQKTHATNGQSHDPAEFFLAISGPNEMTVVPPQKFAAKNRAKTPFFRVDIRRGTRILAFDLHKKSDHTWMISLEPEQSFGKLNVTVTVFKPLDVWTHEIDFGMPWLNISNWMQSSHTAALQLFTKMITLKEEMFSHHAPRMQEERQDRTWSSLGQRLRALQGNATLTLQNATKLVYFRSQKLAKFCASKVNEEFDDLQNLGKVVQKDIKQYKDDWQLLYRTLKAYYRPEFHSRYHQIMGSWDIISSKVSSFSQDILTKGFRNHWSSNKLATAQGRAKSLVQKLLGTKSSHRVKGGKSAVKGEFRQRGKKGAWNEGKKVKKGSAWVSR